MKVELTRFKVKKGKSDVVTEWMKVLNKHMKDVLLTLDGEKMYVETIFREIHHEDEFLYWYSIQGEDGNEVTDSEYEIDKLHIAFWEECIDPEYMSVHINTEVIMIPEYIKERMK